MAVRPGTARRAALHEPSPKEAAEAGRVHAGSARVVAEGAGACPVAVALAERVPRREAAGNGRRPRKIVCVVSGGNVETAVLTRILAGETPTSAR